MDKPPAFQANGRHFAYQRLNCCLGSGMLSAVQHAILYSLFFSFSFFKKLFRDKTAATRLPQASQATVDDIYLPWKSDRTETPKQTTNKILVVSPVGFISNPQTFLDNHFMQKKDLDAATIEHLAMQEFSAFHRALTSEGVQVYLNCNERFYGAPDALFPNNWFSTHVPGEDKQKRSTLFLYPMKAPARRAERRSKCACDYCCLLFY